MLHLQRLNLVASSEIMHLPCSSRSERDVPGSTGDSKSVKYPPPLRCKSRPQFLFDIRQLGEELRFRITLQDISGNRCPFDKQPKAAPCLPLENTCVFKTPAAASAIDGSAPRAKSKSTSIEGPPFMCDNNSAGRRDFLNLHIAQNDLLQKRRLHAGSTRRARQGIINEEIQ